MSATRRGWWRKKRWWIAGMFWCFAVYEASFGPGIYAVERGWIDTHTLLAIYPGVLPDVWYESTGAGRYNQWWQNLGRQHAGKPPKAYP